MDALEDTQSSLGVCCCCLAEGSYKDMMRPYTWIGQDEIYSTMLIDCFGIDITSLEVAPWLDSKRLICELCIARLREASSFKTQVEQAQKTYVDRLKTFNFRDITKPDLMAPAVKLEQLDDSEVDHYNDLVDDFAVDDDMSDILPAVTSQYVSTDDVKLLEHQSSTQSTDSIQDNVSSEIPVSEDSVATKVRREKRQKKTKKEKIPSSFKEDLSSPTTIAKMDVSTLMNYTNLCPFQWHRSKYTCFVCKDRYSDHAELMKHMQNHTTGAMVTRITCLSRLKLDITTIKCKACNLDFDDFEALKGHLDKEHSRKLHDQSYAFLLLFKVNEDKKLLCRLCDEVFENFSSLNTHINVHYRNYVCESCGKSFATRDRLLRHIRLHNVGEYTCKICKKVFDTDVKRARHLYAEHKRSYSYSCRYCDMKFHAFHKRNTHQVEVHNEAKRTYSCKLCPKVFVSSQSLTSHVGKFHFHELHVQCSECQAAFYSNHELKKHQVVHFGARIHECAVCKRSFLRKKTLTQHMSIHTKERFYCPVCGKSFTQRGTMTSHLKVHGGRNAETKP